MSFFRLVAKIEKKKTNYTCKVKSGHNFDTDQIYFCGHCLYTQSLFSMLLRLYILQFHLIIISLVFSFFFSFFVFCIEEPEYLAFFVRMVFIGLL